MISLRGLPERVIKVHINTRKSHRVVWSSQVFCYYRYPLSLPLIGMIRFGRSVNRQAPASVGCVAQQYGHRLYLWKSDVTHSSVASWVARKGKDPYLRILFVELSRYTNFWLSVVEISELSGIHNVDTLWKVWTGVHDLVFCRTAKNKSLNAVG